MSISSPRLLVPSTVPLKLCQIIKGIIETFLSFLMLSGTKLDDFCFQG